MGHEMDTDSFFQQLRQADMDGDPTEDDLEQLIGTAVRRGRRRVVVRRAAGALAACSIVAASVGLAVTLIPGRSLDTQPAVSPAPSVSIATPSPTPTRSAEPLDAAAMKDVLRDLLPDLKLSDFSSAYDEDDAGATVLYFSATDEKGTVWMSAGIGPSYEKAQFACKAPTCVTKAQDGGTLYSVGDRRDPDKSGRDSSFYFERPDGRVVQLFQKNYAGGNDPVTRASLPLTDQQAVDFVTDPVWDDLAARCQPKDFAC